jgi:hypothetical protein
MVKIVNRDLEKSFPVAHVRFDHHTSCDVLPQLRNPTFVTVRIGLLTRAFQRAPGVLRPVLLLNRLFALLSRLKEFKTGILEAGSRIKRGFSLPYPMNR